MNNEQTNEYEVIHEETPGLNGLFPVKIHELSEIKSGNYGSYVIITFEIPGDNSPSGRPFHFTIPFSMVLSKRSRLGLLTKAIFDQLPGVGKNLKVTDLLGRKLVLGITTEVGENFDKYIISAYHPAGTDTTDPRPAEKLESEVPF